MRTFCCFVSLLVLHFSSVNSANVVKQIAAKDALRKVQARIVNGNHAEQNQFPYQVSIRAIKGSSASICGGSILSSSFVLTAAHCTKAYTKFQIGFGSNHLSSPLYRMTTHFKTEHPEFNPSTLNNDISLIKLPKPIPFGHNISPIQLPRISQFASTYLDTRVQVSGFGRTSDNATTVSQELNFVNMKIITNAECSRIFGSRIVTSNVICAKGLEKNNRNACLGDSGGPMAADDNGIMTQIGIVSFVSSRGCSFGDPSGYTSVGKYLNWISQQTGIPLRR